MQDHVAGKAARDHHLGGREEAPGLTSNTQSLSRGLIPHLLILSKCCQFPPQTHPQSHYFSPPNRSV